MNFGGWYSESGGELPTHVYPIADVRRHDTSGESCWCHPVQDVADDGTTGRRDDCDHPQLG